MIHFAGRQGLVLDELIRLTGLTAEELEKEDCTIESPAYNRIVEEVVSVSGDLFYGMHAGEHLNLSTAGLIAQITQTSETVKQALEQCCAFANLGCSSLPMTMQEEEKAYKVVLTPNELWKEQSPMAVTHTAEGTLTFLLRAFRNLTRMSYDPLSIHLTWARKEPISEYERVWACPVHFNANELCIYLSKKHVEEKVLTADYHLFRILVAHAKERSEQMEQELGFTKVVKQSVIGLIKPEFPTIQQVSGHLNISVRTLQRRLGQEGYTYKALLDDLRKDFAMSYLKRPDLSIADVAYLLSYAEVSAFTRSFKRWTGKTPGEYRQ